MRQYFVLVRLFWQQLIRRKSLWIVVALVGVVLLINGIIQSQMREMVEQGVRYDIATRRAAQSLESFASQIRWGAIVLALVVGALVAPPSRRDGTTQFVLTLSVSRSRLALAQYGALATFILVGTLVVHVGYMFAAYHVGVMRVSEALLAWPSLLVPCLLIASASFSLSLTRPALLVYGILLGIPYLALPVIEMYVGTWKESVFLALRLFAARGIDNLDLLFPRLAALVIWPRLALPTPERPPFPAWGLEALHGLAATAFWVVIGLWAYRRHDFGSRIPTK
jgi:ABC-type transport system involved in multi-copper enzyme maturation permease subunit